MSILGEAPVPTVLYPGEVVVSADNITARGFELYPCMGSYHDFVVGKEHAVCNKCQYVLTLGVPSEPLYRTDDST